MLFGACVACGGFVLAIMNRVQPGQTAIKVFGAEITLAAAGGVIVIALGLATFALPTLLRSAERESHDVGRPMDERPWTAPVGFDSDGWSTSHKFDRFYWGVGTRRYPGSKSADCAKSLYQELRRSHVDVLFIQGNHIAVRMGKTPITYLCSDGMIFIASFEAPGTGSSDFNAALEIVDRTNFTED